MTPILEIVLGFTALRDSFGELAAGPTTMQFTSVGFKIRHLWASVEYRHVSARVQCVMVPMLPL